MSVVIGWLLLFSAAAFAQDTSRPEAQLAAAIRLHVSAQYKSSLEKLDGILQRTPDFPRGYDYVMRNYAALEDLESGRVYFEKLAGRFPNQSSRCLGMLHYLQYSKRSAEQFEIALKCTEEYPQSPPLYDLLINAAVALKREKDAAAVLEQRLKFTPDSPGLLYGLGSIEALMDGRRQAAEKHLDGARPLAEQFLEVDNAVYGLYTALGRQREAAEAAQRLRQKARETGDADLEQRVSVRLASKLSLLGRLGEAQQVLEAALVSGKSLMRPAGEMFQRETLGSLNYYLDRYSDGLREYEEALRLATELNDKRAAGRCLNFIGLLRRAMGDHAGGLDYYQRALKLAIEAGDATNQLYVLSNLSQTHLELGNDREAIEDAERALALVRTKEYSPWIAGRVAIDLASVSRQAGRPAKALEGYAASLQYASKAEDAHTALRVRVERALLYTTLGRLQDAETDLVQARALTAAVGVASEDARMWIASGQLALRQRKADAALIDFQKALDVAESIERPRLLWEIHAGLADGHWMKGDLTATLTHRRKAIESVEQVRSKLMTPDQRAGFLASKIRLYKDTARVLDRMGRTRDAFELVEQGRARSMLDILTDGTVETGPANEEARLRRKLQEAQKVAFDRSINGKAGDGAMKAARNEVENAERVLERFWASTPRSVVGGATKPVGLQTVQANLNRGAALLHYTMHPDGGLLFVVTRDRIRRYLLPASAVIDGEVQRLRKALSAPPSRMTQSQWMADARSLYQRLVAPAEGALAGVTDWAIVPDGSLHLLPFEILLTANPSAAMEDLPYLGKSMLTRYVPSASVMVSLRARGVSRGEGLLALGGAAYGLQAAAAQRWISDIERVGIRPLPHSGREVRAVERLYRSVSTRVLTGTQASEAAFKHVPRIESFRILHFAVHGLLNEQRPRLSGLLLSRPQRGEGDDGFLQAFEIAGMKLNAELVVLSACETALGKQVTGEGIAGLAEAFFTAGARGVVASLWNVYDESTAVLMETFHRALQAQRLPAGEALRRARQEVMKRPEYAHPYYWAPFVLMGASR